MLPTTDIAIETHSQGLLDKIQCPDQFTREFLPVDLNTVIVVARKIEANAAPDPFAS